MGEGWGGWAGVGRGMVVRWVRWGVAWHSGTGGEGSGNWVGVECVRRDTPSSLTKVMCMRVESPRELERSMEPFASVPRETLIAWGGTGWDGVEWIRRGGWDGMEWSWMRLGFVGWAYVRWAQVMPLTKWKPGVHDFDRAGSECIVNNSLRCDIHMVGMEIETRRRAEVEGSAASVGSTGRDATQTTACSTLHPSPHPACDVHHLIFFDSDRASGVYDEAPIGAISVAAVDRCE